MEIEDPVTLKEFNELKETMTIINDFLKKEESERKQNEERVSRMHDAWMAGNWREWFRLSIHHHRGIFNTMSLQSKKSK
jgi:hypothetical protein